MRSHACLLCMCWESELRSSCLHKKHVTYSQHPAPEPAFSHWFPGTWCSNGGLCHHLQERRFWEVWAKASHLSDLTDCQVSGHRLPFLAYASPHTWLAFRTREMVLLSLALLPVLPHTKWGTVGVRNGVELGGMNSESRYPWKKQVTIHVVA